MYGSEGSFQAILQNWGVDNVERAYALSQATVTSEINALRPFEIRWGWYTGGGHFLVGRGIEDSTVYYMDPWPGEGYSIAYYSWVVDNGVHTWTHSLQITTDLLPICQVSPTSLNFDTVCVGSYLDKTFTVTNIGVGTLSGSVSESCNDFSLVGATSYSLGAGESDTFTVRFPPPSPGSKICTIETGNDLCSDVSCTGTAKTVPSAPSNCVASDTLCDKVHFCWQDNSNNEDGFRIYRNGTDIDSVGANVTCYDDTTGTPGQTYSYCLEAYNDCGESSQYCDSGTSQAPPAAPADCSTTPCCDSIMVTWTDNSGNEDGFYIYRDGALLDSVGPDESTYIDDNPDTIRHCYVITAFIIGCESQPSDSSCTTALKTPASPTGVMTVPGSDLISVSWENVDNETEYFVYRNGDLLDSVVADSITYVDFSPPVDSLDYDPPLDSCTHIHCYTILATNNCGESDLSESACDSLYQIKGNVRDTASNPIADFAIYVMTLSGHLSAVINDTAYTDSQGNYRFKLPTGDYKVYRESAQYTIDLPVDSVLDAEGKDFVIYVTHGDTTVDTIFTDVKDLSEDRDLPDHYPLSQNYPNPFNPSTRIEYSVGRPGQVEIRIYNLLGEKVRTLVNEKKQRGSYYVTWDGKNDDGYEVSSGIYFYQICIDEEILAKKMILLK